MRTHESFKDVGSSPTQAISQGIIKRYDKRLRKLSLIAKKRSVTCRTDHGTNNNANNHSEYLKLLQLLKSTVISLLVTSGHVIRVYKNGIKGEIKVAEEPTIIEADKESKP